MSELRNSSLIVNGQRTPYLECGARRATEAVVFVHGNPGSGHDWSELLPQVGQFARAVALDMPGFGQAEKSEHFDYTIEGYAQHLQHFLDALKIRRVHLVLHDFGGPWGMAWAAANLAAVASVTLINTGYLPGYRWHFAARIWRLPLVGEVFQKIITESAFRALVNFRAVRKLPDAFVDRMFREYDDGTRRAVLRLYRATNDLGPRGEQLAQALRGLRCPALVIWGRRDAFLPHWFAQSQRKIFPEAQVHLLDDSGHFPYADDPETVAGLLVPFLRGAQTGEAN